jgi:pilus assembly protein CpaE
MADKIKVLIVDDIAETRENIRKLLQFEPDIEVIGMARTGKEGVQLAKEFKPNVVIMDINMPDMDGIQATGLIVKDVPTAQIVIVSVQSDTDYLRRAMLAGARDFLPKPPSMDELSQTIRRLGEVSRQQEQMRAAPVQQAAAVATTRPGLGGKIISVFSPKGGSGKTTVLTNLAIALQGDDSKVVVVDANSQFGDVGAFLNLKSKTSLVNMTQSSPDEMTEEFVQSILVAHPSGVKVLLGAPTPEDAELVTGSTLKSSLDALTDFFHYVLVDTATVLRDTELAIFDASDRIILLATPDIPSLANCKKFFDLAEKLEYPPNKTLLVLNRAQKSGGITAASIEENLKHPVKAQILSDERTVLMSINNGVPFVSAPNAKTLAPTQGILDLAQKVKEEFAPKEAAPATKPTAPAKPKSLFDRR